MQGTWRLKLTRGHQWDASEHAYLDVGLIKDVPGEAQPQHGCQGPTQGFLDSPTHQDR